MKKIIIVGAGGHGKVIADLIYNSDDFELMGFIDADEKKLGNEILYSKVIGTDDDLKDLLAKGVKYAFSGVGGIGDNSIRRKIFDKLIGIGFEIPYLIHNSAIISNFVEISSGTLINAGVVINANTKIGKNVIINTSASIDHDCVIGDNVHIAPSVTLSGGVKIGKNSHIGTGAIVIQGVNIGENTIVGAGAVVVNDLADNITVVGIPAKQLAGNS